MINLEKLKEIENFEIHSGGGAGIENASVMQMVSYIAGEAWTDHPACACPILTTYAIKLNDRLNKEHRQKLKPIIPLLVETQSDDALRIKRKQFFMFRNVTVTNPLLLDLIKMPKIAERLRTFGNTKEDMKIAANFLYENKKAIKENAYAYADADANANAYADANANANANANASAYREKVAQACVETLRLACGIKSGDESVGEKK